MKRFAFAIFGLGLACDASASTINRTAKVCPDSTTGSNICIVVKKNTLVIPVAMDRWNFEFRLQPNGPVYNIDRASVND
ncbi:hypothetical protein [Methylosinus sp. KRF6]|uniref:hypothetical protein n=1 Tax=Methylosinus sp. KRF6 TaxID=2846853 RepID=UPI001C0AF026|nr:hypothetical protein [Methylosinus sp. KRF6]MBU3887594.1 hypothetical protein [Methylosinus sp. KRF6]